MSKKSEAQKLAARKAAAQKGLATRAANKAAAEAAASQAADDSDAYTSTEARADRPLRAGLISINEHNDIRIAFWRDPDSKLSVPNGIGCPNCGDELVDKTPGLIQFGNPPRIEVRCGTDGCDYRALRVA